MKCLTQSRALLLLSGLILAVAIVPASGQQMHEDLMRQSSIVFVGTVTGLGASTLADLPPSPRTIVVQVDQVIDKPPVVALVAGNRVSIFVKRPGAIRQGTRAVFYTNGALFGQTLAVEELGHEELTASGGVAMASSEPVGGNPTGEKSATEEAARLEAAKAASAVFVGRVKQIQMPTATALITPKPRFTEHDPMWREAVVEVINPVKGVSSGEEKVVRFSASMDVAWYQAPKLQVGQVNTFIIDEDTVSGAPRALLAGVDVPAYVAITPQSIAPVEEAERLRALLGP